MLRERLTAALRTATKNQDQRAMSTLRLILAALKDRDIAARTNGLADGISDDDVLLMLQTMVRQRQESISLYEQGGRLELAEREREEIQIIQQFLPRQLAEDEIRAVVAEVIQATGAGGLKEMGKVMSALRQDYAGQMDFGKASGIVKALLSAA